MKKILSVILGLVAMTSLYAANTEVARLTLTGQGGVENSYITLRVDPTVTTAQTGAFFQNTDLDGNVNLYIVQNSDKYSSFKKDDLTNLPLEVITNRRAAANQHYTITFNVPTSTVGLKLKDLKTGDNVDIVNNGTYEFDVNTTLHQDYVEGTNYVIKDRFVINYTFVNMKGNFDNPSGEWNWVGDFDRNGSILTKEVTLAADTWYNFFMNINGTEMHNNSEFSRGDAPKGGFPAAEGTNCWMHSDAPGVYTFTWNHATQELTVTYPTIVVKGANAFDGTDVTLIPTSDGSTATNTIDFTGHVGEWYNFGVVLNGAWTGDNAGFTRADNSRTISGDQNMWFEIEDGTVDYVYTFTWTFATNTLTITFPAVAPTNTVTTNAYGFCSFASTQSVEFLGGLKAYRGQYNAGTNELTLYEIGTQVPANTGVILWNSNGTAQTFNYNTGVAAPVVSDNDFVGVTTAADPAGIRAAGKEIYCLNGNALKQYVGTDEIPAGKAYLPISVGGGSNNAPKHIVMRFNGTTAVDNVEAESVKAEKFVEDGQVYIRRGNEVYNLQGQIVK